MVARVTHKHRMASGPRRPSLRRVLVFLFTVALLLTVGVKIWYDQLTDPRHWVAAVNELPVPPAWEAADEQIQRDLFLGTTVTRYYLIDADSRDVAKVTRDIVGSVGFSVDSHAPDYCSRNPTNAVTGPLTCVFGAERGNDRLWIVVYDRGQRATYFVGMDSHFVGAPNRSVLRITAGDHY